VDPEGALLATAVFSPQLIQDPIGRDDLVAIDQQQGEECLLLLTAQIDGLPAPSELERAEDSELDIAAGQTHTPPTPDLAI
jgi:hypothetical protein